jgi:hypothetical protein
MNDHPALACEAPDHPVCAPADLHSVFAELVCADPGLLQAEFDALIAANFPPGNGRRFRPPHRGDRHHPEPSGPGGRRRRSPRRGPGPGRDLPAGSAPTGPPGNAARLDSTHDRIGQESKPATRR